MKQFSFACAAAAFSIVPASPPACGGDRASAALSAGAGSEARLVAAGGAIEGAQAGLHLKLGKGWKTYWRNPGEAGMPPSFDWSGSKNLKHAEILWPAPARFTDAGISFAGYADEVLFPVAVTPADPNEPVVLNVKVAFGVCKDICLPSDAHLILQLPAQRVSVQGPHDALIARAMQRVPRAVESGGAPPHIESAQLVKAGDGMRLVADVLYPRGVTRNDLFAEADGVALPLPIARGEPSPGVHRFDIALSAEDGALLADKPIRYTIVSGDKAREAVYRIGKDKSPAAQGVAAP